MTPIQATAAAALNKRQFNSLRALQNKIDQRRGLHETVYVTAAQRAAIQAAYDAVKAAGHTIPPEMLAKATALGLE